MIRVYLLLLLVFSSEAALGQQFTLSGNGLHSWCTGGNPDASECYNNSDEYPEEEDYHEPKQCLDLVSEERSRIKALCKGYIQAAHDVGTAQGKVCTATEVKLGDMAEIFVLLAPSLFESEPSKKDNSAIDVAVTLLSRAFPCSERNN